MAVIDVPCKEVKTIFKFSLAEVSVLKLPFLIAALINTSSTSLPI